MLPQALRRLQRAKRLQWRNIEQDEVAGSISILRKLKSAFVKRAKQVDALHEYISKSPYPVILCGDFNDTPTSYTYHTVRGGLRDAFVDSGTGMSGTYAGKLPSFRIDYILYDKKFKSFKIFFSNFFPKYLG